MNKKLILAIIFLISIAYYWMSIRKGANYYNPTILATHSNGEHFVGSETCKECHADIYDAHLLTAHYNTSALVNAQNIKGHFEEGANTLELDEVSIKMLKKGKEFYQQTTSSNATHKPIIEKMDVVIGSGVKGQSYLTWKEEDLFQLQASYYPPSDRWINSPGYPSQRIQRPILDACLKCHVTFATNQDFSGRGNQYDKEKMVYGVDCEKCHRPAAKHVIFHRKNPAVKTAKFMLKLDTMPQQRRLDACAQCHSGLRGAVIKGNSFSYLTGEKLDEYTRNYYTGVSNEELDVHGNQYGLLTSSKCFKKSPQFDCSTCHNPHTNQRGNIDYFNQKCKNCHSTDKVVCSAKTEEINAMGNNCTTCHMPNIPSKGMTLQLTTDATETPVYVRTHLIGIYSEGKYRSTDAPMNKEQIGLLKEYLKNMEKEATL